MAVPIVVHWVAFVASHFALSHPPVRASLVARLGAGRFLLAYSVVSLALFGPMVWIWWKHRHEGALLIGAVPGAVHVAEGLGVLGVALMAGGLATPAPSSWAGRRRGPLAVRGMVAITRHPLFMGLSLWALGHLLVNGRTWDVAFFAGFPLATLVGCRHQDWRKAAADPSYADFVRRTSFFPSPARLGSVGARGWGVAAAGAVLALVVRALHPMLFGG